MTNNLEEIKKEEIKKLQEKVEDKMIEPANLELLSKLISKAESETEVLAISALGTTYNRTGLQFDKRLETVGSDIRYLEKDDSLSFGEDNYENANKLIIGDNYPALLNLLITHKGMIDVIYIDPPYSMDGNNQSADTNYQNRITRDNLLSLMYPRLKLAKQLLSDDGVIFCSIDDKNQAYLKCLFDEIFSERNFITSFVWEKTSHTGKQVKNVCKNVDYILCYSKNPVNNEGEVKRILVDKYIKEFEDAPIFNKSNNPKELIFPKGSVYFKNNLNIETSTNDSYVLKSPIKTKLATNPFFVNNETYNYENSNDVKMYFSSRWSQKEIDKQVEEGTKFIIKTDGCAIRAVYSQDKKPTPIAPWQIIKTGCDATSFYEQKVGSNESGSNLLDSILDIKNTFSYPKPSTLIAYLLHLIENKNAIVLDFFAGSGTTGQAVLELNKEDGGNRHFILCTNNQTDENNVHGIALDVTSERLKRVMTGSGYKGETNFEWIKKNDALGGTLDVYWIKTVRDNSFTEGETPFDVIDEHNYGKEFTDLNEKIDWVCNSFEKTLKRDKNETED